MGVTFCLLQHQGAFGVFVFLMQAKKNANDLSFKISLLCIDHKTHKHSRELSFLIYTS